MARKPMEQNINEYNIRQSMWEEILRLKEFQKSDFKWLEGDESTKKYYIKCLKKAKIIEEVRFDGKAKVYKLVKLANTKIAPKVNKDGVAVFEGKVNQRMWQVMKIQKTFTSKELAEISGATLYTARTYIRHLTKAGYLRQIRDGKKRSYQFLEIKNSGYFAPMIQKTKTVFDPNLQTVIGNEEVSYALD